MALPAANTSTIDILSRFPVEILASVRIQTVQRDITDNIPSCTYRSRTTFSQLTFSISHAPLAPIVAC